MFVLYVSFAYAIIFLVHSSTTFKSRIESIQRICQSPHKPAKLKLLTNAFYCFIVMNEKWPPVMISITQNF